MSYDPSTQPYDEIAIGDLRHRITFQQKEQVGIDATGEPEYEWANFATVWADVKPIGGREIVAASNIYPEADTRIVMRWRRDIDPAMRIFWHRPTAGAFVDRQFDICAISDVGERHHQLVIIGLERPIERNI